MFRTHRTPAMGPGKSRASIVNTTSRGYAVYISEKGWMGPDLGIVPGENPFYKGELKKDFKVPADAVAFKTYDAARNAARYKYDLS